MANPTNSSGNLPYLQIPPDSTISKPNIQKKKKLQKSDPKNLTSLSARLYSIFLVRFFSRAPSLASTFDSNLSIETFLSIFPIRSVFVVWKSWQQAASKLENFWAIELVLASEFVLNSRLNLIGWGLRGIGGFT